MLYMTTSEENSDNIRVMNAYISLVQCKFDINADFLDSGSSNWMFAPSKYVLNERFSGELEW